MRNYNNQIPESIEEHFLSQKESFVSKIKEEDNNALKTKMEELANWSKDLKRNYDNKLKKMDQRIRERKNDFTKEKNLKEKTIIVEKIGILKKKREALRQESLEAHDENERQIEVHKGKIEKSMNQTIKDDDVFTIRWAL